MKFIISLLVIVLLSCFVNIIVIYNVNGYILIY